MRVLAEFKALYNGQMELHGLTEKQLVTASKAAIRKGCIQALHYKKPRKSSAGAAKPLVRACWPRAAARLRGVRLAGVHCQAAGGLPGAVTRSWAAAAASMLASFSAMCAAGCMVPCTACHAWQLGRRQLATCCACTLPGAGDAHCRHHTLHVLLHTCCS